MYGYHIFEKVFFNLNVSTQQSILKKIFSLEKITEFNILILEKKICFRFFEREKFSQFVFELQDVFEDTHFLFKQNFCLENRRIFLQNYVFDEKWHLDAMSVFVKILLCEDEQFIYYLISLLL